MFQDRPLVRNSKPCCGCPMSRVVLGKIPNYIFFFLSRPQFCSSRVTKDTISFTLRESSHERSRSFFPESFYGSSSTYIVKCVGTPRCVIEKRKERTFKEEKAFVRRTSVFKMRGNLRCFSRYFRFAVA